jgi:hypothetical protein
MSTTPHSPPPPPRSPEAEAELHDPPAQVVRSKGLRESLLDMGRSLGLMALIMAVVLLVTPARGLIFPDRNDRMPPVDYAGVVAGFGELAHHPAAAPVGVPSSWRANAANLTGRSPANVRMHIGWVVAGERFAGLDETTGDPSPFIASVLGRRGATVSGTTTIAGATWDVRTSDRGERAYTSTVDGVTIVVTGNAHDDELARLCSAVLSGP